ncbi:integral membrane protein [Colletotrichum tofieldiae]|uniref:Integral membrane protein n=1 Tax=Colletotrichum tofieldiae TaxID=708197 RepID=A0A166MPZ9_9PEZI|nr:integral membrane protein [Colletotrichum tofieldiae]
MVFMILAQVIVTSFFSIHVSTKLSVLRGFRVEDWSYLLGWVFITLHNITVFIRLHFGEGFHIWEITASDFTQLQKSLYAGTILFSPAAFFTKAAILLLVVRVFAVEKKAARIIYTILAFFLICHIAAQMAKALVCIPVQAFWDPTIPSFKCIDQNKIFAYDTSLAIISDLTILAVPIILMWKLRLPAYKKIKFVGILGAGGLAVAVTSFRLVLLLRFQHTTDPTVDFVPIDWTATGEVGIGLICASFPSINYLLEQRITTRVPPNIPRTASSWRVKALRLVNKDEASQKRTPTTDSDAQTAVSPEIERTEPQQSGFDDIELAVR